MSVLRHAWTRSGHEIRSVGVENHDVWMIFCGEDMLIEGAYGDNRRT